MSHLAHRILLLMLIVCEMALLEAAPPSAAVEKVREGVDHFSAGRFEDANKAFVDAEVIVPENPLVQFDRACALSASGDVDKARDLYREASLARESSLAIAAHYNLGGLAAKQGQTALGEDPVAAKQDQRQQGIAHLLAAVGHYRDCLRIAPLHSDARHNIELIRLFIKHIQAQWEDRDREQARKEKDLLQFLAMIEERQVELRSQSEMLQQQPASPQQRQTLGKLSDAQRSLRDEIAPLQEKMQEQLNPPTDPTTNPTASVPAIDPEKRNQLEAALTSVSNEAGELMLKAADSLQSQNWEQALKQQREAVDRLNEIYAVFAPFANVLQRALRYQEALTPSAEADKPTPPNSVDDPVPANPDFEQLAWQQKRISNWSRTLDVKAKSELESLPAEATASTDPGDEPSIDTDPAPVNEAITDPGNTDPGPADAVETTAALKKALAKAIELGPEIVRHSEESSIQLKQEHLEAAVPEQRETLRLLKEIAELMPRQQQNQDQQDSPNDQQQSDQDPKQNPQEQSSTQQQQDESPAPSPSQQQPRDEQSAKEKAMSVLRRAREREQKHRELQKQSERLQGGRLPVERDW